MNFQYIASDPKTGKRIASIAAADSIDHLVKNLHSEGLLPLKVTACNSRFSLAQFFGPPETVKGKELAMFTRQLGSILNSGLVLTDGLEIVAEDMENEYFKNVIRKVRNDITAGSAFSLALMKYPKVFSKAYCQIIRSGEESGQLYKTISNLALHLEKVEQIGRKVKSAMAYPMFILIFTGAVMSAMLLLLVPKFKEIYSQVDAQLPLPTQMIMDLSDFVLHNILWIIVGAVLLALGIRHIVQKPEMKGSLDNLKTKIPLMGKAVVHKSLVSQFCRTFGFLISSGVEISSCLDIVADVVDHEGIKTSIKQIRKRVVTGGSSLSMAIREHKIFPRLIPKMVSVGEKAGRLSEMLTRTADYYDQEVEQTITSLLALIEPTLIAFVGGMVAVVVVALYLPIFKLATLIK
jgi:type IV pilus assembly protein PilC